MRLFYKTKIILIIVLGLFYGQVFAIPTDKELIQMYRDATQIPSKQAERNKLFFSVSSHLAYMNERQVENIFNDIGNLKTLKSSDGDEIIAPNLTSLYKDLSTKSVSDPEVTIVFKNILKIVKTKSNANKPSLLSALVNGGSPFASDAPYANKIKPFIQSRKDFMRDISQYKKYLSFANLWNVNLDNVDLNGADLRGAVLVNVSLVGANLTSSDLRGADLTGANLDYTDLTNSDLRGVILPDTNLENSIFSGIKYDPEMFLGREHLLIKNVPLENPLPPLRLINKTAEDTFEVNLDMFKRLSESNHALSKEIRENSILGALGSIENINLLNKANTYSTRHSGITDIYSILNVELVNNKEYSTISYPATTVISDSFEIDSDSFSSVIFTDNYLLPITYQEFKNQVQLNDLQMQKLALSIVASRIGGSTVDTLTVSINRDDDDVLLDFLTIRVKTGNEVVKANYSPLVNTTFLNVIPILPGNYDSVLMRFQSDQVALFQNVNNNNVELLNKAIEFIKSGNNVNIVKLNNGNPLADKEKLSFIAMVLKLSGSRYLGNSAFGGDASPHVSGLILVTQLRSGEIFPGLKNSVIINNLKYHRNDIYQKLFTDNNGEGCIDSLGFDLFDFIRHGA